MREATKEAMKEAMKATTKATTKEVMTVAREGEAVAPGTETAEALAAPVLEAARAGRWLEAAQATVALRRHPLRDDVWELVRRALDAEDPPPGGGVASVLAFTGRVEAGPADAARRPDPAPA